VDLKQWTMFEKASYDLLETMIRLPPHEIRETQACLHRIGKGEEELSSPNADKCREILLQLKGYADVHQAPVEEDAVTRVMSYVISAMEEILWPEQVPQRTGASSSGSREDTNEEGIRDPDNNLCEEERDVLSPSSAPSPLKTISDLAYVTDLLIPKADLDSNIRRLFQSIGDIYAYHDRTFLRRTCPPDMLLRTDPRSPTSAVPLLLSPSLQTDKPTIFVLTSTHPATEKQWKDTIEDLTNTLQLRIVPLIGINGAEVPCMVKNAWRRARLAWALCGFPQAIRCISLKAELPGHQTTHEGVQGKEWYLFAEDSAKTLKGASLDSIRDEMLQVTVHHPGVEIVQLGFRRLTGQKKMPLLDLATMKHTKEDCRAKVAKIVGQKLFMATRRGVDLMHRRLLMGPDDFFDNCVAELIRAGVAMRSRMPITGCRTHYSLVDGGKQQAEEMAIVP
jgi:hypothetical protein